MPATRCAWIMKKGKRAGLQCLNTPSHKRVFCYQHHTHALVAGLEERLSRYADGEVENAIRIEKGLPTLQAERVSNLAGSLALGVDGFPNRIVPFGNLDKDAWTESWYPGRSLINFPHPYRACVAGRVSCGKGTLIKNLIVRAEPPFERIVVLHVSPENTEEWNDVTEEIVGTLPEVSEINTGKKTMLVIDDYDLNNLSKTDKSRLDRYFGFVSSHCNLSIVVAAQDLFRVPTSVRKNCNVFCLWKVPDKDSLSSISRRLGIDAPQVKEYFKTLESNYDNITFDMTGNSPAEVRKNIFEVLQKNTNL